MRLYNPCFMFSFLCKTIIENPQKMTARKFYGCHFHCMIVHAPQTHRIFCLRSLVQELEERSVILWPETHIPKYFKSTVWQGYRECYFRIQYPTTNWQRGELSKTGNYHKSASKITATVRGHQIFIRNLTKSSLLIPDSLPENCWFSARGTKHLVVHTGKEYCISRWHFSSWAALK